MARKPERTRNLVVVGDIHAGCKFALCPPEGACLTDGGPYFPSVIQKAIWAYWRHFWDEWVPRATHGEPWDLVLNGDLVDGVHHNATTQISQNKGDQKAIALTLLKPVVERCRKLYVLSGTPVHGGESGVDDEAVAKELGAVPDRTGRFARYELRKWVGDALVHVMHHIGTTGRTHYESSAVMAELSEMYVEAARWGELACQFVVRSHRHRHIKVEVPSARGYTAGVVTPGWQAKTPFVYLIPGGRMAPPQFGGVLVRQGDEEAYTRSWVKSIAPAKPEE